MLKKAHSVYDYDIDFDYKTYKMTSFRSWECVLSQDSAVLCYILQEQSFSVLMQILLGETGASCNKIDIFLWHFFIVGTKKNI